MSARVALLLPFVVVASGCSGCHEDHPYVPYTIGTTAPLVAATADAAAFPPAIARATASASADAGSAFAGQPATVAPPGTTRWPLDGAVLEAPEGRVFVAAIVADLDGDGAKDAFAIVRPPEGNDPGEFLFMRARAKDGALVSATSYAPASSLARDASCTPVDRLVRVGVRAVLVELGAQCPAHPSNAPVRWAAVVAAPAPPGNHLPDGVRFAATLADPPGSPSLTIDADTADRDGDSLPDVALRVSIEGGGAPFEPGPRVSATLAWLDRPAGLSRDASATDASFLMLATSASVRARSARDAATVPRLVAQALALWRAMCADGGAPRLVGVSGSGTISCGAARPLEELGLAEVRAYVTMADQLRALLALDRAQRPPATHTASRTTDALAWVAPLAPVAMAHGVRSIAAVPLLAKGHEPSWGALAFEASGKLLVRTGAGVVRVDPEAGDEASADGVAAWPSAVVSLDGAMRWIETYDPCDGVALRASFAPSSGDDLHDVALPVAPPLGNRCSGSRGAPAHALPVAWGPRGLEAIVEGEPLLVAPDLSRATLLAAPLDSPALLGAPRSPDGRSLVVATSTGLLARGPGRSRLLRAAELEGTYGQLRDCAVSNDGTHVACVRADKALVGAWDAP
jgi:hypothetical protein